MNVGLSGLAANLWLRGKGPSAGSREMGPCGTVRRARPSCSAVARASCCAALQTSADLRPLLSCTASSLPQNLTRKMEVEKGRLAGWPAKGLTVLAEHSSVRRAAFFPLCPKASAPFLPTRAHDTCCLCLAWPPVSRS